MSLAFTLHFKRDPQFLLLVHCTNANPATTIFPQANKNGGLQCVLKSGTIEEKSPKIVLNEVGNGITQMFSILVSSNLRRCNIIYPQIRLTARKVDGHQFY